MRALVTGGGGYLGSHIVAALRARGEAVTVVGRRTYPYITALGACSEVCDLSAPDAHIDLTRLLDGVEVVFHTAALPPEHHPTAAFVAANITGTRTVLAAMRAAGTPKLVHTSTPSVVHGGEGIDGLSEAQCHVPTHHETPYAQTKAVAEADVLAANSAALATIALRPHLLYGPGEPHMLPRLLARHKVGRLRIVGDGTNRVGLTYIDNAVAAHLAAAAALTDHTAACAGRAYFHHDAEPVVLWSWINAFLTGTGAPPLTRHISRRAATTVGAIAEALWAVLPLKGEPPMTRFVASQLATHHHFNLSAIHRDLHVADVVSGADGLERTVAAFRG